MGFMGFKRKVRFDFYCFAAGPGGNSGFLTSCLAGEIRLEQESGRGQSSQD
jgi:hypothetical protein